jgi:LemA protein
MVDELGKVMKELTSGHKTGTPVTEAEMAAIVRRAETLTSRLEYQEACWQRLWERTHLRSDEAYRNSVANAREAVTAFGAGVKDRDKEAFDESMRYFELAQQEAARGLEWEKWEEEHPDRPEDLPAHVWVVVLALMSLCPFFCAAVALALASRVDFALRVLLAVGAGGLFAIWAALMVAENWLPTVGGGWSALLIAPVVVGEAALWRVGAWAVRVYNGLVPMRNEAVGAWSHAEIELARRRDLVPRLVDAVRGYAAHERETFEGVTRARSTAAAATDAWAGPGVEGQLGRALGRLLAVAERYPDLQASPGFRALQAELVETEGRIAVQRQAYNDAVLAYDNLRQVFPTSLISTAARLRAFPYFETRQGVGEDSPLE